jgi:SnoaL-like domain
MNDGMSDAAGVVEQWHRAVNAPDVDAALALCVEDVAVGGPRGDGHGHDLMRAWLVRSGIQLEPQEALVERDGRIVVHERAQWRTTADAPVQAPTDAPADTWVVFEVTDELISAVRRYETAAEVPPA